MEEERFRAIITAHQKSVDLTAIIQSQPYTLTEFMGKPLRIPDYTFESKLMAEVLHQCFAKIKAAYPSEAQKRIQLEWLKVSQHNNLDKMAFFLEDTYGFVLPQVLSGQPSDMALLPLKKTAASSPGGMGWFWLILIGVLIYFSRPLLRLLY